MNDKSKKYNNKYLSDINNTIKNNPSNNRNNKISNMNNFDFEDNKSENKSENISKINRNNKINYQKNYKQIIESEKDTSEISKCNQTLTSKQKINILIRFSLVILGFSIWLLYRFMLQSKNNEWKFLYCFEDRLLTTIFLPITNYISQNLYIRDFLLIASSAFLDIFMVCFICIYIAKGSSWGPLLHMGLFYGLRGAVVQNLVIMQIYDTYIFKYPGFPSLIVPYFRAADFFYSGHSGCALLIGLHMADMGYSEMKYVGFILSIFEGLVLTMLRIHYSIDIIFGIITSHYLYFIAKDIAYYLDWIYPMGLLNNKGSNQEKEECSENKENYEIDKNKNISNRENPIDQNTTYIDDIGKNDSNENNIDFVRDINKSDSLNQLKNQIDEIKQKRNK